MKGSRRYDNKDGDGSSRGGDGSSSDDDSSSSSSSSSASLSDDENSGYNSPTPSDLNNKSSNNTPTRKSKSGRKKSNNTNTPESKTWDSMDGYEIRKNALNLLNSPDSSHSHQAQGGERKMNSISYQSYQDSPYGNNNGRDDDRPAHQYYSSPHLSSPSSQPHHDDGNLSVYHVASLAFNCMVHCLTEGYRAASTYYNSYPETSFTGGTTASATSSFSHMGNTSSYENVSSYHDESQVMDRETQPIKPGASNRDRGNNYQNHNEVPPSEKMGVTGDYTTVKVPSYQGRK